MTETLSSHEYQTCYQETMYLWTGQRNRAARLKASAAYFYMLLWTLVFRPQLISDILCCYSLCALSSESFHSCATELHTGLGRTNPETQWDTGSSHKHALFIHYARVRSFHCTIKCDFHIVSKSIVFIEK